jgi:LPXTG-motif cell wall-anchored protein
VTIKATTLEKLATGDHTVTIRFDDGTADAKLKVNKASAATSNSTANRTSNSTANRTTNSPRTGDENHAGLWIAAVLVSALAVCGLVIARKRKSGK